MLYFTSELGHNHILTWQIAQKNTVSSEYKLLELEGKVTSIGKEMNG